MTYEKTNLILDYFLIVRVIIQVFNFIYKATPLITKFSYTDGTLFIHRNHIYLRKH